jgi:hypothetical protein
VQIDPAIVLMLVCVEAHLGLLLVNTTFEDGRIPYLQRGRP